MTFWLYLVAYLLGLCCGVAANLLLDVQLHRPALSKQIALAAFGILVGVIATRPSTRMHDWVLPLVVGCDRRALAGLGSRESRAPIV